MDIELLLTRIIGILILLLLVFSLFLVSKEDKPDEEQMFRLPPDANCLNCSWYEPNARTCHRYPPDAAGWQTAKPGNWCGEWKND